MIASTCVFFVTLILINSVKTAQSACQNVNKNVECNSLTELSNTEVSEIPGISDVTVIDIARSQLEISPRTFRSATKLERLIINDNKIKKISFAIFENLPVKLLYLGFNEIETVVPGAFTNLSQLEQLRLDNNKLRTISKRFLTNLPLKDLVLSKNQISVIEEDAFEDVPNLKKLKLDNNKLEYIFVHKIVSHPQNLEILWLHNNSLSTVTNFMLQRLRRLTLLNLGFNFISYIETNSFEQTPALEYLVLSNNYLREVDGRIFPFGHMQHLEKLYLDNNKLMYLSSNFFVRVGPLKKITIVGNPWLCPCLGAIERLLIENNIQERCNEEYANGRRPVCVNDKPSDTKCVYSYNSILSEKYEKYKKDNPLFVTPLKCLL